MRNPVGINVPFFPLSSPSALVPATRVTAATPSTLNASAHIRSHGLGFRPFEIILASSRPLHSFVSDFSSRCPVMPLKTRLGPANVNLDLPCFYGFFRK